MACSLFAVELDDFEQEAGQQIATLFLSLVGQQDFFGLVIWSEAQSQLSSFRLVHGILQFERTPQPYESKNPEGGPMNLRRESPADFAVRRTKSVGE